MAEIESKPQETEAERLDSILSTLSHGEKTLLTTLWHDMATRNYLTIRDFNYIKHPMKEGGYFSCPNSWMLSGSTRYMIRLTKLSKTTVEGLYHFDNAMYTKTVERTMKGLKEKGFVNDIDSLGSYWYLTDEGIKVATHLNKDNYLVTEGLMNQ